MTLPSFESLVELLCIEKYYTRNSVPGTSRRNELVEAVSAPLRALGHGLLSCDTLNVASVFSAIANMI